MAFPRAIEHRSTRGGRWLRDNRLKLALWIAVVEGLLVVLGVVEWWAALLLAFVLVAFYVAGGRTLRSDRWRTASWIGAVSQILVAFIPIFVFVFTAVAVVALAALAIAAIVFLFANRR